MFAVVGVGWCTAGVKSPDAARSSFVGREREMPDVKAKLAMSRLLTLTGAGGSGKSQGGAQVIKSKGSSSASRGRSFKLSIKTKKS